MKLQDLHDLKHKFGLKIQEPRRVKRHIHVAAKGRSPLLTSMFPVFDKFSYASTHMLDRGFDNLTLNLPAEVLISNKPINKKNTPPISRPETRIDVDTVGGDKIAT